ncbi:MAG: hypothetical protein SNJ78_06805 [Spirochaetales bacterium]
MFLKSTLFTVFLLYLGGILFFFSCSQDTEGIFYSLEVEEKAVDNSLPNDVRITGDMIKVSYSGKDLYYVCAGSLFYREANEGDIKSWYRISTPLSLGIVSGIAEVGGEVFASYSSGDRHGLFRIAYDGNSHSWVPSGNIPQNLYEEKQISRLFSLNNTLFAIAGTVWDGYDLLYWNGSNLVSTGIKDYRIVTGAWDGAHYWFATPSHLFRLDPTDPSTPLAQNGWSNVTPYYSFNPAGEYPPGIPTELQGKTYFTALFADTIENATNPPLYLCSSDGYIFKTEDGGTTWIVSDKQNRSYQSITRVGNIIVLAAGGSVIRELPDAVTDDLNTVRTPGGNFGRLPDLYGSNVIRVSGFGNILYAGTSNNGLWRGDYSNPDAPVWSQE